MRCQGIGALALLLCSAICAPAQTRYELRIGEPVEFAAPRETVDFLANAKTRRVAIDGQDVPGIVVAPNQAGDRLLLAASSKVQPGAHTVTVSAAAESGEQLQTTLNVVVQPRATVPKGSTRPPVVLLNGWQIGFSNSCPVASSSSTTFGNLAQYLVSDGVPVVYLFDNCVEDPNQTIETLAGDLGTFLNTIKYDDGTQVQQIDLVCHSMGGLIARAYLSGLQPNQTYAPPANTLIRKAVFIATPNFGSFVAGNYATSLVSQSAEMVPGSSLLWNLATWNQNNDDLHGVDAIAVIGNAGSYSPNLTSSVVLNNGSDGLVSLASAALGFVNDKSSVTRIVPYCHVDPAAFTNTTLGTYACNSPGIANITSTTHPTSQIVRSFLSGTTDWQSIGTATTADRYLVNNGGMFFAVQDTKGNYLTDLTQVTWGSVGFTAGGSGGTIYYADYIFGSGAFSATSTSVGNISCGTVPAPVGTFEAIRCKLGSAIFSVTPLASAAGRVVAAGTTITINGAGFGGQCNGCQVVATPAASGTQQTLAVTSWGNQAISVKLPVNLTGLVTLTVQTALGIDSIGIVAVSPATIAVAPASLQFAYTPGGATPAVQTIQITNSGLGALAWTATASDSWLSLSAASGTAPSSVDVSVSPANLAAGTYNGSIQISAVGTTNSPLSIPVTLTVAPPPPSLVVAPQALTFNYTAGSAAPPAQDVSVANGGAGTLSWTASSGAFWAAVSAASGNAPGTVSVSVNPANLAPGNYATTVTIAATGPSSGAASVAVTLVVQGTQPAGTITAVVNAGSFKPGIASGAWLSIFGTNLSQRTYTWQAGDIVNGVLPSSLQGVSVTISGVPAYIDYISPTQINVLAPDDPTVGPVQVQVATAGQASNAVTVQKAQFAPAFLTLSGTSVAALHADYTLVSATAPAKPGETILLYGEGFGATTPPQPSGQAVAAAAPLANTVQITIGGVAASVQFAGLVQSGLYQFNVTVPAVPNGDAALVATIGGSSTQAGVTLTVQP